MFSRDEEFHLVILMLLNVFQQSQPSGFGVTEGWSIPLPLVICSMMNHPRCPGDLPWDILVTCSHHVPLENDTSPVLEVQPASFAGFYQVTL